MAVYAVFLHPLSKSDTYQMFGTLTSRVDTDQPFVALTLDDGPSPRFTAEVLDILAAQDATVTFFLTGHEVERRPDLARDIIAAGHEVGNHSYSHNRLVLKPAFIIRRELSRTDTLLREAGFSEPLQFRAPYGHKLFVLPWVLSRQNRANIMWDVKPGPETMTPEAMARDIVEAAQPGPIILMHVM